MSKMEVASQIFNEVYRDNSIERPRQVFIREAQEHGLTEAGASTYHQMLKDRAEGKDMYRHHRRNAATVSTRSRSRRSENAKGAKTPKEHPWGVYNKSTGKLIATAPDKAHAQVIVRIRGRDNRELQAKRRTRS